MCYYYLSLGTYLLFDEWVYETDTEMIEFYTQNMYQ